MEATLTFQLLEGCCVSGPGSVWLFLTSGSGDEESYAECFLLVPREAEERRYREKCRSFGHRGIPDADAQGIIRNHMMAWVKNELEAYLVEWRRAEGPGAPLPPPYDFRERDPVINALAVRDLFGEQALRRIKRVTGSDHLREYLNMLLCFSKVREESFDD